MVENTEIMDITGLCGKGESILIVDDVKEQREIASVILKKLGYTVFSADSGERALSLLSAQAFDLLILDMIMETGIDGLDTYEKALAMRPGQKAIIVSGFSETDRVRAAQSLGRRGIFKKALFYGNAGTGGSTGTY